MTIYIINDLLEFHDIFLSFQSNGIVEKTLSSQIRSQELLTVAKNALEQTEGTLENELKQAQNVVNNLADQNRNNTDELDRIDR